MDEPERRIVAKRPQIPVEDVTLLAGYVFDQLDGPMAGLCLYCGKKYYYRDIDGPKDGPYYRLYALHTLLPEQEAELEYWCQAPFTQSTPEDWVERLNRYKENNPVVGWFGWPRDESYRYD